MYGVLGENQLCKVMGGVILPFDASHLYFCDCISPLPPSLYPSLSLHLHQNLLLQSALALNLRAKSYTKLHSDTARRVERRGVTGGGMKRKGCEVRAVSAQYSPAEPNLHQLKAGTAESVQTKHLIHYDFLNYI